MKPHTRKAIFFSVKIMIVSFIAYIVVLFVIGDYARQQQDSSLLSIYYLCATGINQSTFKLHMYNNGTHTIDTDSCRWIKNAGSKQISAERAEIHAMYCSEILERHESGESYLHSTIARLAESKVAGCKALKPQYHSLAELFFPWL